MFFFLILSVYSCDKTELDGIAKDSIKPSLREYSFDADGGSVTITTEGSRWFMNGMYINGYGETYPLHLCRIEYSEYSDIYPYSASGEVLHSVIHDAITAFPAMEYGLILWSHGTGWLPEGVFDTLKHGNRSKFRSFGFDSGKEMKITELAENLPVKFEFIIFDACLMSNIETLYELRNAANYIIAYRNACSRFPL